MQRGHPGSQLGVVDVGEGRGVVELEGLVGMAELLQIFGKKRVRNGGFEDFGELKIGEERDEAGQSRYIKIVF